MIEFLPYGNVTVFALILAAVLLAAVLVNQVALLIGRIALSLDDENAPKILESNWLWSKVKCFITTEHCYLRLNRQYLEHDGTRWHSKEFASTFDKTSRAFTKYISAGAEEVATQGAISFNLLVSVFVYLLLVDLAILWLQHHFLSAVWVLSTVGIIFTLRFITGKLWNHNKRITTLEEK